MAYQAQQFRLGTMTASSDYNDAADQFCVVVSTNGTTFKKQLTNGGVALGILQDTPSSGTPGDICIFGVTKARVNNATHTAIVGGLTKLCASTSGGVIPSTTLAKYVLGRALESMSSAATGIITMLITHEGAGSSAAGTGA